MTRFHGWQQDWEAKRTANSHTIGNSKQNKYQPWIVAVASICNTHTWMQTVTTQVLRGVAYCMTRFHGWQQAKRNYWQHLTAVAVLLACILSSRCVYNPMNQTLPSNSSVPGSFISLSIHWIKRCPQIVAYQALFYLRPSTRAEKRIYQNMWRNDLWFLRGTAELWIKQFTFSRLSI